MDDKDGDGDGDNDDELMVTEIMMWMIKMVMVTEIMM